MRDFKVLEANKRKILVKHQMNNQDKPIVIISLWGDRAGEGSEVITFGNTSTALKYVDSFDYSDALNFINNL